MSAHCWHQDGAGTTMGFYGGTNEMRCCYCGDRRIIEWRLRTRDVEGHGPFVSEDWHDHEWPAEDCYLAPTDSETHAVQTKDET